MKKAVCRKCRREGTKLFLKGDRCLSPKCSFTRRSYFPGLHGSARKVRLSDYGLQLREKQKTKTIYGLRERQFKKYYQQAMKTKKATGEKLLQFLETRLDNVVYRLGFASSIRQARQMVGHKNIMVNGKKINLPSYLVKAKDKIEPREKKNFPLSKTNLPVWLKLDKKNLLGEVVKIPSRQEISTDINEELIVEFYSK